MNVIINMPFKIFIDLKHSQVYNCGVAVYNWMCFIGQGKCIW